MNLGSSTRSPSLALRALLLSASAVAMTATAGCDVPPEGTESGEDGLARSGSVDVGGATRGIEFGCIHSCAKYENDCERKKPGYPCPKRCVQLRNDCYQYNGATLTASPGDPNPWGTTYDPNSLGCGPKAAQNVLAYLNVSKTLPEITPRPIWTLRFDEAPIVNWFTDNIATLPDVLRDGLQTLLNQAHGPRYSVQRKSFVNVHGEILSAVTKGMPIIVLVNKGGHYQVVTALDGVTNRVHTLDNQNEWRYISQLETDIPLYVPSQGVMGFNDHTVITIEKLY